SRSLSGCWTCRLRKKKCDEERPFCSTCSSLGLYCDGYEEVPSWKDGHSKESRYLAMIKSHIKSNFRRKSLKSVPQLSLPDVGTSQLKCLSASAIDTSTLSSDSVSYDIRRSKARESELVMYYIDTVFYIQFRFYSFAFRTDRRGWLHELLSEKPFYNACLSLSSYADAMLHTEIAIEKEVKLRESDEYFSKAIAELNCRLQSQFRGAVPSRDDISIVMCIIQLISLEQFQGGKGNWKIHLQAAINLLHRLTPVLENLMSATKASTGIPIHSKGRNPNFWHLEEMLLKFAFAIFLWFETIACTLEKFPSSLFQSCKHLLEPNLIDLTWVTGCENWVWLQISEIAALQSWKDDCQQLDILSLRELTRRATAIENKLTKRDENRTESVGRIPSMSPTGIDLHDISATITRIFSLAALTYLHVVVSGPNPNLPEIQSTVSKTLAKLKELNDRRLIRSLVWPFCVTGCLVEKKDRTTIKSLLIGTSLEEPGNLWSAFRIIEECWKMRDSKQGHWEWRRAMASLNEHVFLI
ncbi:fungal-specific transcription factor domain-containing protein, partial [Xylogone sp. PMI_703]